MICYYYEEPQYLFFAADLPELLYYSHIPAALIALMVGIFVFSNGPKILLNRLLLAIAVCFSTWTFINLIAWTNIHSELILFAWSFFGILQALISVLCIYFIYVLLTKEDISVKIKSILLGLTLPTILLASTTPVLQGFNIAWCDAFGYESLWYTTYYSFLGLVAAIWILVLLIQKYRVAAPELKKQIIMMGIGIESFLLSFFTIDFVASYFANLNIVSDSRLEFYGLFGMTVFMVMIGAMIVRFKTFNVSVVAPQALVIALLVLVASQFTFVQSTTGLILTAITLVLTALAGLIIIRNVKQEIKQREEIEKLAVKLEKANKRLKVLDQMKSEFVSIASHQLRSPLTSIRGYASMLLEGSFGQLSEKAKEAIVRIGESSRLMALSIEDYLNVSRIQSGNMKYELSDFNAADMASEITDDMRQEAIRKGLLLTFKNKLDTSKGVTHADVGKTHQILHNLLDNSMKYTPKGSIEISVRESKRPKQIHIDIADTGIGMEPETITSMFDKFERAENANDVNVTGTGLGLYIARKMAQDMGGDVTASSPGTDLGSTFTLTLPLHM